MQHTSMRSVLFIAVLTAAAAGLFVAACIRSGQLNSCHDSTPSWYVKARQNVLGQPIVVPDQTPYRVLGPAVWPKTVWGNCSFLSTSTELGLPGVNLGQQALCQLPSVWRDCSAGIYLDVVSPRGPTVSTRERQRQQQHTLSACAVW